MDEEIIKFRQTLHKNPELSNMEFNTSVRICNFIKRYDPDEIIKIGETGLAFVFKAKENGKTIMFRAELDALPVNEETGIEYKSINENVAHSCGHDGHMAILAGLAQKICTYPLSSGKVVLLFQPAEEVKQGALDVVENSDFQEINPDYIFALHNIPRVEKHRIILKKGSFASASKGMTIKLSGKTSHAAEPENGINPAHAIAQIIMEIQQVKENPALFKDFVLLTIIHVKLGEIAFGTSPGYAEIRITLRAFENEDMKLLTEICEKIITKISTSEKLSCEFSYSELFPATVNNSECVDIVEQSAKQINLEVQFMEKPFKWSEDFAYYSEKYKTCYLGLGAGIQQPQLHNPDYNFPDDIIETGVHLFYTISKTILKNDR